DRGCFAHVLAINVLGVVHGTQVYVHHRRRVGGGGVLINISSGAAQNAYAGWSAYCASKAAVDRFSEAVALEEADTPLRVHAVAPGVVDTDMQRRIRGATVEQFPAVAKFHQLKAEGRFNSPDHVARELLAMAFDPRRRPDQVVVRVADQGSG
ncbi:MAG: SDR family NAD(P)-dependent oxidoreductase, partial [Candidatus Competibacterales bacterium]